jgi:hypothetical protein
VNNDQAREIVDRFTDTQNLKLVPMIVAGNTPLRVYLNNDTTTECLARSLTGAALADGATGFALWAPPMEPLVFTAGADAGWVNVSYEGGFDSSNGGQLAYRKLGSQVFLKGGANKGTDFTNSAETVAVLPAEARPGQTERFASYGAGGRIGRVEIETNGNINVAAPNFVQNTGAASAGTAHTHNQTDEVFIWMGLSHTYLTD